LTLAQAVAAIIGAIVGGVWIGIQIYSWLSRRPRLEATIRGGTYATDPRYFREVIRNASSVVYQGDSKTLKALSGLVEDITKERHPTGFGPEPNVFYEVVIKNRGSTTLQSVRLITSFVDSARIIRHAEPSELLLDLSGVKQQTISIGALGPGDEVTVHAWGQSMGIVYQFRLTHADGHGRIKGRDERVKSMIKDG
jgi:hypothetical protein